MSEIWIKLLSQKGLHNYVCEMCVCRAYIVKETVFARYFHEIVYEPS